MGEFQKCMWVLLIFTVTGTEGRPKVSGDDTKQERTGLHSMLFFNVPLDIHVGKKSSLVISEART